MNLRSKGTIEKSFEELSRSVSESDRIMIETRLLMYRFLSEIDKVTSERGISRKELAELTGTSASYITQLYQGKKIINLQMLTRIKKALGIDFKIEIITAEKIKESDCAETINMKSQLHKTSTKKAILNSHIKAILDSTVPAILDSHVKEILINALKTKL